MKESLRLAKEELKRADHLIYVSLKYTRTVDVIKSIIERLINCFELAINALLQHAKTEKKIREVPTLPRLKAETCKDLYSSDAYIQNHLAFYQLLRKIDKAGFDRAQEYRRHVTMTVQLEEGPVEITIDIIHDYYERTRELVVYIEKMIDGHE